MNIAYFVNQHPLVSTSFIRREINALERNGCKVFRTAIRGWLSPVVDPGDMRERQLTRYIMQVGGFARISTIFRIFVQQPALFVKTALCAIKLGFRAEKAFFYSLIYFSHACILRDWYTREKIDHVHAHFGTNSTEVLMYCKLLGGPSYSFTVHGPEEFDKNKLIHLKEKVRHASFVIAISAFTKSQLFRWVDFSDWSKIHEVHCGLEADFYNVSPVPIPEVHRLVCVGRLCEQKGQMLLVEAIALLAARQHKVELVLAGDGEMRAEIEAQIRKHRLESQISITGWITSAQVREYMQHSSAMILPSFAEGLPVVIMEAMALKRPVLTTYVAGIPELVVDGITGWLFPAGDVEALAGAIQGFMETPVAELSAMGVRGYERVIARHAVDTEAQKLIALFKSLPSHQTR
ncbi:glycosyltransferase family 4 protein [Methylovorus mays]|uniref:glycosyltransferase family 4 protein n=1 Tax=Methylovorus mays TaxID=184077 RepID=UPI001E459E16|nr:glycosyltransferase family 4 protein [Methylovorus mays]MCB5206879.1 glycosyltransferase family 4 protein [Methylovorus mays]